ncbi:MAG: aldo/keto reductase [Eubacteriales bacterium]|nr:aldo/keto reductase [Eubacteriales bacterium]
MAGDLRSKARAVTEIQKGMIVTVQTVKLNNGMDMPILGLGTMRVKNLDEVIPEAVDAGYRLIDTAANYDNEIEVGNAIRKCSVGREELFITSKLQIQTDGYNGTIRALEDSLRNLQLDYVDLYLIHQPYGDIYGEWRALEKLQKDGKIRAIGVSNFEPFRLMDLMLHNDVKPVVNQIEVHPWFQQEKEHNFHQVNGIQTEAWAPFAENKDNLFSHPLLQGFAQKYHKSVQQIILRWVTQRGIVAIPRTSSVEHVKDNLDIFDFTLTPAEMCAVQALETGKTVFLDHLDPEIVKMLSTAVASPYDTKFKRPSHDDWSKQRDSMKQ